MSFTNELQPTFLEQCFPDDLKVLYKLYMPQC